MRLSFWHCRPNFRKMLGVYWRCLHLFCQPRKSIRPDSSRELCSASLECDRDGRLLLAIQSLFLLRGLCTCQRCYVRTVWYGCWHQTRVCAVTTPYRILSELDRVITESTSVSLLEVAKSTVCSLWTVWCCLRLLNMALELPSSVCNSVRPSGNAN